MKKDVYDLTNPQKSIWLTEQFYKGTAINNICGNLIIRENVDFDKFETAINLFVKTNESFRLKFFIENSIPKQYVSDFSEFKLDIIDINSEDDIIVLQKETASEVFEVIDSLLFKFKLVRLPDGSGGFIINAHHLISDAATFAILATEIVKIYSSLLNHTEFEYNTNLYTDYIKSEQAYIQSEKFKKDEAYWNELYSSVPETASIPTLLKYDENSLESLRESFVIPKELFEKINIICKKNRISSYNLFMAIYAIYLSRVSNLYEFVIGTPILNRTNFSEKNTSGMFISTVPFKISINHELTFADFSRKIGSDSLSMLRHQKYPYQFLLENLRKNGSHVSNLYDFMFSYQITKATDKNLEIPYTTHWTGNNQIANSLEVHAHDNDGNEAITIAYDYKVSKYTKKDIFTLHNRILYILEQVINNPEISLQNIEIVTPEEKNKILYEFNNTKVDYPKNKTIVELFEEQVEKTPNNIAVVFENKSLTYKELNEKANSLAWYLRNQGITRNNIVGIMLNRSIEMIIAILATLKSGACYVPIDPEYPSDRVSYMLENSNALFLISRNYLVSNINFSNKILDIDLILEELKTAKNDNLPSISKPDDLSYIIYTSGSTGKPKGVMLKHKSLTNLTNYCNNYVEYLKNNSYKTIVSITTVSFDIFIFETLISLQKGLKLVIANEDEQVIPRLLNNLIEKENIQIIQTTPSRMQLLLNNYNDIPELANLKYITLAGEQLPLSLKNDLVNLSNATIYNGYGPSETTVFSTYTDVTNHSQITIGKPLDNTQIYILDKNLNPCPIGVSGEIYISGDGVGLGYMSNPELTENNYIDNPFIPNTIMYKTGDLGIFKENGEIICLGRCDNQVKIRGLRIELEEIESKISEISNISNCVVLKKTTSNNHEFLCAYYIKSGPVNIDNIRKHLSKALPNYMIPQYFVELDELPYTPNGKINKKTLPEPVLNTTQEIIPSRNDIDLKLLQIFEELFNTKNLGINYSFFDIGGDSLSAINLCTRIFNTFNTQITVKDILNNPIISDLSDFISKTNKKKLSIIPKAEKREFYPASSAQKRIYYSSKVAGDVTTYNMPGSLILSEIPDIQKLEKCFNKIIEKHETLRTYFDIAQGEVVQKIKDKINFKIDFAEEICTDKYSTCTNFVKPFDLSKAPLLRAKLVKLEKNQALLLFDMHHIISDGTSMQILINELCKLYNGEGISPLEITYKDYSVWEQNNLNENKFKQAQKYWVSLFKDDDIPVLNLPTNYPRPTVQSFEGGNIYKELNKDLTLKINNLANKLNITPYMLLLSCYYILLYKYTANDDIIVGTPIVGRDNSQVSNIIGMFVNSLPLRTKINSNETFLEFSNTVKEMCLNSFEHQTYPFDELVNKLNIKRDSSRNPLFDTMFIYQNEGKTKVNLGNIKSKYYIPDSNISKFDLSLEVIPENNKLNLRFEYASRLFNKEFIEYLSTHYINILNTVLENIYIKISDIEILSQEEKNKILYEFNNTKVDYPKNKTIVELFEEQVEKTPNNISVVFENKSLTYKELNNKANILAKNLVNLNTKQNDIIGLLLPRSLDLIVSIWGVLKSGAGYILIDPSLPNERINYMLKKANAHMLITYNNFKNIKYNSILNIENIQNQGCNNLNLKLSNENNLAIIYTSGSTGDPKGVMLKQGGLINLLLAYQTILNTNICTNFLCTSAVSFDMFMVETFIPILSGKTIILANDDERQIPTYTSQLIKKSNAEFILTTPSKIDLLLTPDFSSCLRNVKIIQLGGEVFTSALYEKLSKVTNANIFNGYGPTEITACCSSKKVSSSEDITIGKPICNTKICILDKDMNLCPIDVPGELCVLGDGISKGYINNEEATNKVFVKTKYFTELAYKTGDIAKFNKNGELVYIGRNDNQIKIRGLRIELSEIENKMLNIKNIEKCVIIYKKGSKNPHIVAFFTASHNLEITDIRKKLSETLPAYMIPKYIVQIDEMPITTNGKINTKELYNIQIDVSDINYVPPKTDKQKLFCRILEDLLNVTVGITDDLFELGLDSLIAIKFKVELMNNNIDIPYSDIFKYHTVKELCDDRATQITSTDISNYNYDGINKVLSKNTFRNNINIVNSKNNNILLLGSTGYVGIHVLKSFIEKDNGNIYCIVRDKNNTSAKSRFIDTLHFYFGTKLDKYIDKRIFILKGDLLKENFDLSTSNINLLKENIDLIINSAANVKHYGNTEKFNSINIDLAQNLINFCKNNNKKLIHLSSLSISGNMVLDGKLNKNISENKSDFTEKNLYIGQALDNVYTRSKFEAERLILDNINLGLNALILRLGNITNRYSDGFFQINPNDNAFLTRVTSLINIGAMPESIIKDYVEFTPVDLCGDAIVTIMQNDVKNYSVLHVYDYNHMYMDNLVLILKKLNINIDILTDDEFASLLTKLLKDSVKKNYASGIINDLSSDKKLSYESNVNVKSNFSIRFLEKIGFTWPEIDENYIIKYVKYIRKNNFI